MREPAPKLTIAVVVRGEQAWLDEFAGSVLGQPSGDVELVAIDDASQNHAPAVLDAIARDDGRARVVHIAEPAGEDAARARARAVAEARGEHVWLVRPTDLVAPGALAGVASRLAAGDPDVLLVHHVRRELTGADREGRGLRALERVAGGRDTWQALRGFTPRTWSAVVRRELLASVPAAGEIAPAWCALLVAESVDALAPAAYVRRTGVDRARGAAGNPFGVPGEYERVVAFARDRGAIAEERRSAFAASLLRHQLELHARLDGAEARRFFDAMSASYSAALELGALPAGGRLGQTRARFVARGNHAGFATLERARRAADEGRRRRRALSRSRGRRRSAVRRDELRRSYESRLREPIDPDLAVFGAFWYRGYSDNPRAIYEKARELVPGMRGVWVVARERAASIPDGVEHVVAGTREYYDAIARARILVNNVNFPGDVVKREGSVHVMTHHGTPLKFMGLDEQRSPVARMDFAKLMRRCSRWDFSVTTNPHNTLAFERAYPGTYETLEVGYPRNDVLVSSGPDEVRRAREELGIEPGQTAILYTPTHREWQRGFVPVLDVDALADALPDDHVVLARAHYFYAAGHGEAAQRPDGRVRDVADHPSIEQLLLAADVLVTDYSSIMFDYALLDRPIVIHAPDWEVYRTIRGTYFDLMTEAPGVVTKTEADLAAAFRTGAVDADDARRSRAAFRARFCTVADGRSAERVVRRVWLGETA